MSPLAIRRRPRARTLSSLLILAGTVCLAGAPLLGFPASAAETATETNAGDLTPGMALVDPASDAANAAAAAALVADAERLLAAASRSDQRANWIHENFITEDTEALASAEDDAASRLASQLAERARAYDGVDVDAVLRRKLELLKRGALLPSPHDPAQAAELARLASSMNGLYGSGEVCPDAGKAMPTSLAPAPQAAATAAAADSTTPAGAATAAAAAPRCQHLEDLEQVLATSREPAQLLSAWEGWHRTARRYRDQYARFVELANQGSREAGDADLGVHWRSNYDMAPDAFAVDLERLWLQLQPLYHSLHTYVRNRLIAHYGDAARRPDGLIPAHLLGNMWAQEWDQIFPLLDAPPGNPDLTPTLVERHMDPKGLVHAAEGFFTSLGFAPLPETFWTRSLFERPRDRDVVCHASAWDLDDEQDVRLKMCIHINEKDFTTAHHELGHNFYQLAYAQQPFLFKASANDGFHEAIGDTIALSVTPEYLKAIGLIQTVPGPDADIALLLHRALNKVAFIPFAYLVDQWRWRVFAGDVGPEDYDRLWWELRAKYQGVARPLPASPGGFDAGAKYHVAANVPYARYFLADVLQFQFHRALCREAGYSGPLHRCSIYRNAAAGARLKTLLTMGASQPWPEALKAMTGEEQLDAGAILDYFAPLRAWLDARNAADGTPTADAVPAAGAAASIMIDHHD
ncbi:MAG: M2 family metallopeptidase [Pseudomonadota bacterium]|nr:M2 family metallopeptidase [Pseudomonadota bacterium]